MTPPPDARVRLNQLRSLARRIARLSLCGVDPADDRGRAMTRKDLTQAQRSALDLVRAATLYRVRGGWQGRGTPRVNRATVDVLLRHGLVWSNGSRLALTDAGKGLAQ